MDQYKLRRLIEQNPDARLRDLVADLLREDIVSLRIRPGSRAGVKPDGKPLRCCHLPKLVIIQPNRTRTILSEPR